MATMANIPNYLLPKFIIRAIAFILSLAIYLGDFEMFFQINFVMFQIAYRKNINIEWNIENFPQKPDFVVARIWSYPRAVLQPDKTKIF